MEDVIYIQRFETTIDFPSNNLTCQQQEVWPVFSNMKKSVLLNGYSKVLKIIRKRMDFT